MKRPTFAGPTPPREREVPIAVLLRYFRVPTDLPVDYPGREVLLQSRITNVSVTGLFIRTPKPPPEGTELAVTFRLPGTKADIQTQAVVRWRTIDGEAPGMGVEFKELGRSHKRVLDRFVRAFLERMRTNK